MRQGFITSECGIITFWPDLCNIFVFCQGWHSCTEQFVKIQGKTSREWLSLCLSVAVKFLWPVGGALMQCFKASKPSGREGEEAAAATDASPEDPHSSPNTHLPV